MAQENVPYYADFNSNFEIDFNDVGMVPEDMGPPVRDQKPEIDMFDTETDDILLSVNEPPELLNEQKMVSKDKLLEFIDGGVNKQTKAKTDRDAQRFLDFLHVTGEERVLKHIPSGEMDAYLGTFFMDLRKKNGDFYEPTTITSFFWYLYIHYIIFVNIRIKTLQAYKHYKIHFV